MIFLTFLHLLEALLWASQVDLEFWNYCFLEQKFAKCGPRPAVAPPLGNSLQMQKFWRWAPQVVLSQALLCVMLTLKSENHSCKMFQSPNSFCSLQYLWHKIAYMFFLVLGSWLYFAHLFNICLKGIYFFGVDGALLIYVSLITLKHKRYRQISAKSGTNCIKASLVAQMVKNPSAMWETWVWSLGWGDPLEEGMGTHCHSCLENPYGQRSLAACSPCGLKESDMH